jgi:AbrB family looped-hinge helix DNA binding protein
MAKVRVGEDGWLSLPASARRMLGLQAGSLVDVEVRGGTLVLRPAAKGAAMPDEEPEPAPAPPQAEEKPRAKRGRPRKNPL